MILRTIRKNVHMASMLLPLVGLAASAQTGTPFVVTASNNATANQLLVYTPTGNLIQSIPTEGKGGASGNGGGLQTSNGLVAVVNFGSNSVSIFQAAGGLFLTQVIPTVTAPVSVAFSATHLYILGAQKVESHLIFGNLVAPTADGSSTLLVADGSAAQVGVLTSQIIVTEKSNVIETFNLLASGAVSGAATSIPGVPAFTPGNPASNEPFGLVTRGNDAYVTIAHDNAVDLVRNNAILTPGSTNNFTAAQTAPCWATLTGPFLYTSNTASQTLSRFAVYGQHIVNDAAVVATFPGNPTDNASGEGLVAAIDGINNLSHLSIFTRDEDGNLTTSAVIVIPGTINGVAVVPNPL